MKLIPKEHFFKFPKFYTGNEISCTIPPKQWQDKKTQLMKNWYFGWEL